jgi:hypothetical protein
VWGFANCTFIFQHKKKYSRLWRQKRGGIFAASPQGKKEK